MHRLHRRHGGGVNGEDDDCDGTLPDDETDSDSDGARTCDGDCDDSDGAVFPGAPEVCNNVDDDCDDQTDEEVFRDCELTLGECRRGSEECENGEWSECRLPTGTGIDELVEIYNDGLDNDCDGSIYEDRTCVPGATQPCGTDEGECLTGTMSCLDSTRWNNDCEGEIGPETETCDGLDNDCDGHVDESC